MKSNEQIAVKTARNSMIINILLTIFKLFAGILSNSAAMVSDAVHSIADLFSTAIAIIGIKLASKQADKDHPYGHERFECVAALILAILIITTGLGIGWAGLQRIISGENLVIPGVIALVAAGVSIFVKEGVYRYMRRAALKIDSGVLMADAWHSRIDGLSSIGSFIGILGARMGFPVLDSVAAIVISIFILKTGVEIIFDAIGKMTDKACDSQTIEEMTALILAQDEVESIDQLRTRLFGNKIYVDVEISADQNVSLQHAHDIAHRVHDAIEQQFPKVKHCMVHVNPK